MLKIVKDVMAILKASDEAKVEKFFRRQIKFLEKEVTVLEQNMASEAQENTFLMSEFDDRIEDQEEVLANAWLEIPESALVSNKAMDEFGDTYRNSIKKEEQQLKALQEEKERLNNQYQERLKEDTDELKKLNEWITHLKASK